MAATSATLLDARHEGSLPDYMVRVREGNEEEIHYFPTENANCSPSPRRTGTCSSSARNSAKTRTGRVQGAATWGSMPRRAVKYELHESVAITRLLARLEEFGVRTDPLLFSDDVPLYELVEGGDAKEQDPMPGLQSFSRSSTGCLEIGRRGIANPALQGPR